LWRRSEFDDGWDQIGDSSGSKAERDFTTSAFC